MPEQRQPDNVCRARGKEFRIYRERDELHRSNERFLSTKQLGHEGFGLASICAVAKKYGGSASFEAENSVFTAKIILFESSKQASGASTKG